MTAWSETSDEIDKVSNALVHALGAMTDIVKGKTADVGTYRYSYADLGDALAMARPVLLDNGLAVSQVAHVTGREVAVFTTLLHDSGQFLTSQPFVLPGGGTAQAVGSAVTYARRYALMAMLGLASEDDDGAAAAPRPTPAKRRTEGGAATPATAPPSGSTALFERLKAAAGTPQADKAKEFAHENGKKLNVPTFAADPAFAEQVAAILDSAA